MPRRMAHDPWLFFTAAFLVLAGLFMVGSAAQYEAVRDSGGPAHLMKQAVHIAVGGIAFLIGLFVPYTRWNQRWIALSAVGVSAVLLLVVLAMPPIAGVHRWIRVGPASFQVSELAKLSVVMFLAVVLSRRDHRLDEPPVVVSCLSVIGALAFLIYIEPDLGSACVLALIAGLMLYAAGLNWKAVTGLVAAGAGAFALAVMISPYKLERIKTFLDPEADTQGSGFQLMQSLIAVGSGGLTGVGPGQGQQKAFFLPEAHTDFIFSVIGEELGLVGTGVLLGAFMLLYWRGLRTALRAPDRFGFYLAFGITHLLVIQALMNMGVCLGLLPTTGLPLPLISYGGSSALMSMAALGLLLNVSQYSN